jgi:stage V sporulation protein R
VHVAEGNHENKGELLLVHRHEGLDLDPTWSAETLAALARIWSRPASVVTERDGKSVRLRHDGNELKTFDA